MAINKTVQAVFDKAIYLINEQNEATGATVTQDTREYQVRTIGILNNLLDAVYPASDTYEPTEDGSRPALDDITAFTDELDLDARALRDILPNGLAAKLLSEENPDMANYFQQLYEAELNTALRQRPSSFEDIENPYGRNEYGGFSRWHC